MEVLKKQDNNKSYKIIVEGDFACFTRPEHKVERLSYDVPTPGALEGLLKSIYWKPAMRYVIDKIVVFSPIEFINIKKNEVKKKINKNINPIYITEERTQRSSRILKNVKYGIEFHIELTNIRNEKENEGLWKHRQIIEKRFKYGKCFQVPCLGCSEYLVKNFYMVKDFNLDKISEKLKNKDIDLGFMLYKMKFEDNGIPKNNDWIERVFVDNADPLFYHPYLRNGIINISEYEDTIRGGDYYFNKVSYRVL